MDFMKVLDQTVREIKREVNLKVLKVPEIERKVLDATDGEPWGPHGTALAEIEQATKKIMVMTVLWTRLGETGKDWRYVYKYLISHGYERAVDDIIEHSFQISSLTSFECVEPNGKDMGINVRKKAENTVSLLNNKDKIQESRNKAATNRHNKDQEHKFSSKSSMSNKYGQSTNSHSNDYDDDDFDDFNPRGTSSTDVGIVGGSSDTDEREKGPPTSFYVGTAMGSGSGLGRTGYSSSQATGDDLFSTLGGQHYHFNGLKK